MKHGLFHGEFARRRGGRKFWTMRFPRLSTRKFTMKESVFLGFDTRFIKLEFDAETICCLGFLITSRNKILRAISRFRAPPRNCRKCENRDIFAISFERVRAFKFCFEGSKALVPEPRKQKEYSGLLSFHARGSARRAENRIDRQNLTRCIFATRAIQPLPFAVSLPNLALVRRMYY